MDEKLGEYVVRELGRHHKESDIVFAVAKRSNLNWNEAQQLVDEIKATHGTRIARRQSPLLVGIGLVTAVAGLFLTISTLIDTLNGVIIFLLDLPIPYLGNVVYLGTGLAMVAGAAWGLGQVVVDVIGK